MIGRKLNAWLSANINQRVKNSKETIFFKYSDCKLHYIRGFCIALMLRGKFANLNY